MERRDVRNRVYPMTRRDRAQAAPRRAATARETELNPASDRDGAPDGGTRWRFHPERAALADEIAKASSIPPLLARLLVNRGVTTADDVHRWLRPSLDGLGDPFLLPDMEIAVTRTLKAVRERERIVVYGDSDVDGVCGTALLVRFLRQIGADVMPYIPNRLVEGYSLTDRGLAAIAERGARLVITVDNGTTAVERVARLRADGIDVVICDHHEAGKDRAPATALLNAKVDPGGYPFPHLCGTGVAFQFVSALASRIPARPSLHDAIVDLGRNSIALVALATICDCVPLIGENRILASAGIRAFREAEHPGLTALRSIAGVGREVQSDDLSFRLGPRINAAGRLGQAERALALMLADEKSVAVSIAKELDERNGERQVLEAGIHQMARIQARERAERGDPILLLADDRWHAGVVGIVASRIAAEFDRPAILVALDAAAGRGRGSGRSTRGFDLHRALTSAAHHIVTFGGHAFAAGLEVEAKSIDPLRAALFAHCREHRVDDSQREILIDAELPLGMLTPSLMAEINRVGPFGEGVALPIFSSPTLAVDGEPRRVGRTQNHLSFNVVQGGNAATRRKAIAYNLGERAAEFQGRRVALVYTPRLNFFRGQAAVELEVKDVRFA
jgi:single-stranded-DNA-specific exonuclease